MMRDHHRHVAVAANAERLVERLQNRLELRTQVGGINSPLRRQLLGQRHHLFGGGLKRAGVGQPAAQTQCPLAQRVAQLHPHSGDLGVRRRTEQIVHMVIAQRGMANQRADVQ